MKRSAALLPFRFRDGHLEVFLVHPGGPFWAKKDAGAWSLTKGEYTDDEDPLTAARREFGEETGFVAQGEFLPLGEVTQKGGKGVIAWAFETDFDAADLRSNTFTMEWPPRAGKQRTFPEVDRGEWMPLGVASAKVLPSQLPLLERLRALREAR